MPARGRAFPVVGLLFCPGRHRARLVMFSLERSPSLEPVGRRELHRVGGTLESAADRGQRNVTTMSLVIP